MRSHVMRFYPNFTLFYWTYCIDTTARCNQNLKQNRRHRQHRCCSTFKDYSPPPSSFFPAETESGSESSAADSASHKSLLPGSIANGEPSSKLPMGYLHAPHLLPATRQAAVDAKRIRADNNSSGGGGFFSRAPLVPFPAASFDARGDVELSCCYERSARVG